MKHFDYVYSSMSHAWWSSLGGGVTPGSRPGHAQVTLRSRSCARDAQRARHAYNGRNGRNRRTSVMLFRAERVVAGGRHGRCETDGTDGTCSRRGDVTVKMPVTAGALHAVWVLRGDQRPARGEVYLLDDGQVHALRRRLRHLRSGGCHGCYMTAT